MDFKCGNVIIEYDGDYWHKNKDLDKLRDTYTNSKNYNTLRIMGSEYGKNKKKVISKCKEFINENAQIKS